MTGKDIDHIIKKLFQDYDPGSQNMQWDRMEEALDKMQMDDAHFDQEMKTSMEEYVPDQIASNWAAMDQLLVDDANQQFDEEIKEKVEDYETPYEPKTWPVLKDRLIAEDALRRRLYIAKILEIACVLIALMTFVNFYPNIKTSVLKPTGEFLSEKILQKKDDKTVLSENQISPVTKHDNSFPAPESFSTPTSKVDKSISENLEVQSSNKLTATNQSAAASPLTEPENPSVQVMNNNSSLGRTSEVVGTDVREAHEISIASGSGDRSEKQIMESLPKKETVFGQIPPILESRTKNIASANLNLLATQIDAPILNAQVLPVASPLQKTKTRVRLGLMTSVDVNILYIPEDNFYSSGKPIEFTEKTIAAPGYGAGVSLSFDRPKWGIETGLYYSSKTYEPNRILQIGQTFDIRTLDFRNINLNMISIPLNLKGNIDGKGKWRLYALGGVSFNVIAEAQYDLIQKNNLKAPAAVQSSEFMATTQEVQRVREHILDGAKFSSKSYFTANTGIGLERYIGRKFSVYLQPTYQYQVPFVRFSDNNGKHLQSLTLQFGTRVPIN
jgi:hypothetical protein